MDKKIWIGLAIAVAGAVVAFFGKHFGIPDNVVAKIIAWIVAALGGGTAVWGISSPSK